MVGIVIGLIVVAAIGMVHYQVAIAPMADEYGNIIEKEDEK